MQIVVQILHKFQFMQIVLSNWIVQLLLCIPRILSDTDSFENNLRYFTYYVLTVCFPLQ